jgi:hypothetical protein
MLETPYKGFRNGLLNVDLKVSDFLEDRETFPSKLVNKKAINFKVVFHRLILKQNHSSRETVPPDNPTDRKDTRTGDQQSIYNV